MTRIKTKFSITVEHPDNVYPLKVADLVHRLIMVGTEEAVDSLDDGNCDPDTEVAVALHVHKPLMLCPDPTVSNYVEINVVEEDGDICYIGGMIPPNFDEIESKLTDLWREWYADDNCGDTYSHSFFINWLMDRGFKLPKDGDCQVKSIFIKKENDNGEKV